MKGLSPVMFEDFVKPFQINLDEVSFLLLTSNDMLQRKYITWLKDSNDKKKKDQSTFEHCFPQIN